jgi:hypothetical protein
MPVTHWFISVPKELKKMAFKYEECQWCAFHDVEPGICDECEDASEYQPSEEDELEEAA